MAIFGIAIFYVVEIRADEQMLGINAGWIVTGVTDAQSRRDGPPSEPVREPVGGLDFILKGKPSISIAIGSAKPDPASVGRRTNDLRPESPLRVINQAGSPDRRFGRPLHHRAGADPLRAIRRICDRA